MLPLFSQGTTQWTVYPFISSGQWEKSVSDGLTVMSEINRNHPEMKHPLNITKYMGDSCFGYVIKSEEGVEELWKIMSEEEKQSHYLIIDDWVAVSKYIGDVEVNEVKLDCEETDLYSVLLKPARNILVEMDLRGEDWFYWKKMMEKFFLTLQYIASKGIILSKNALDDCLYSKEKLSLATLHGCLIGCKKLANVRAGLIARNLLIFVLSCYFESVPLGGELLDKIGLNIGENDNIDLVIIELRDNAHANFDDDQYTQSDIDSDS